MIGEKVIKDIEPITYNFYNLDREQRYDFTFKKTLEYVDFVKNNGLSHLMENNGYLVGSIFGMEKFLFGLHSSMVRNSVELWGTEEQRKYWIPKMDTYEVITTYGKFFEVKIITRYFKF